MRPIVAADSLQAGNGSLIWFGAQFNDLQGEMAAETQQWGEEMSVLSRRGGG